MSDLPKAYEPQAIEEKWYSHWLDSGCFHADPASEKPAFSIVIPPPNVTGVLTLGHVLNNTLQDILCRRARMTGHEVLWLPGTDHAGLATQAAVEKAMRKPADLPPTVKAIIESKPEFWDAENNKPRMALNRHTLGRELIDRARVGVDEGSRRHHHPAAQETRRVVRLGARALHDGQGVSSLRAGGFRGAVSQGLHLSRQPHGELGPGVPHGDFRRGGHPDSAEEHALHHALRGGGGARHIPRNRDHPPGDAHGRYRRGGEPEGPALSAPHRQALLASVPEGADSNRGRRAHRSRVRHRRAQGDAGA